MIQWKAETLRAFPVEEKRKHERVVIDAQCVKDI